MTYPGHLLLLKPPQEGCCFFPHSLDCTATSHFPSQTATPLWTLFLCFAAVSLPAPCLLYPSSSLSALPCLGPHFSAWLTVIRFGPNPAVLSLLSSSPVWRIHPAVLLLGSFASSDPVTFASLHFHDPHFRLHPEHFSTTEM